MLFSQGGKPADEGTWLAGGLVNGGVGGRRTCSSCAWCGAKVDAAGCGVSWGARLAEELADWAGGALGVCAWGGGRKRMWGFEHLSGRPDVRGAPDVRVLD